MPSFDFFKKGVTTIPRGSRLSVKFRLPKREPPVLTMGEEIVYIVQCDISTTVPNEGRLSDIANRYVHLDDHDIEE